METKDHFVGLLHGHEWKRVNPSENYIRIPPALIIPDRRGDIWGLGNKYVEHNRRYYWDVLRNDMWMGEFAQFIEYDGGRVKIYTPSGAKIWSGKSFI